jgi:2-dehydro-3-deoxyphosphogluconate aldolase/(4S)-4-hydroxy-2-oxoglutarate aldolase
MKLWDFDARAARVDELLGRAPVLPVLSVSRIEDAVPLARALVEGGLPVLELTLRSEVALAAINAIRNEVPDAIVGAGTVLDANSLSAAAEAGAQFAISPGATEALYAAAEHVALPWIPAVSSASELMRGLEHGHGRFKFFPAESSGGTGALRSLAGPFAARSAGRVVRRRTPCATARRGCPSRDPLRDRPGCSCRRSRSGTAPSRGTARPPCARTA